MLSERFARGHPSRNALIATGLAVLVLADLDVVWFYLVNHQQNLHHEFLFQWPLFWVDAAGVSWLAAQALSWRKARPFIGVAIASLLLHMVLDGIAAGIAKLMPLRDAEINLVAALARHGWWVWNFILHWTFLLELAICGWAVLNLWRNQGQAARA